MRQAVVNKPQTLTNYEKTQTERKATPKTKQKENVTK
jgi:hypothetical protein